MTASPSTVSTAAELLDAIAGADVNQIVVEGQISDVPSLRLAPGQMLQGADEDAALLFVAGVDGLQLTRDNRVHDLHLAVSPERRAIHNDTRVDSLGNIVLSDITTIGQVQILARDKVRGGHVEVSGLDVIAADARAQPERPQGFGVHVLQGAFTLWNMQADASVVITARLTGLSAGRAAAPVRGSGIFVGGAGFEGGRLAVSLLETDAIYSDGGIAPGTPDMITGGVFTVFNAFVDVVRNLGPVTTYGVNDMVLDNWGSVDRWIAEDKITSYGPSGIGFVNFGIVNELDMQAPIETFGQGARGFNQYAGTVNRAVFDRITTHADGSVGIQVSQPIGTLEVHRGIETFGGTGDSLVKGVVVKLSAIALSIKPGGSAHAIDIEGGCVTHGKGVSPLELFGAIGQLSISGGVTAASKES
jgi:hypothetical protein